MLAADIEMSVLDFETTGRTGSLPSEPWQIGIVRFVRGRVRADLLYESWLHVGDRPFNPYAPGRHARVREQLAAAAPLPALWPEVGPMLRDRPLAAHSVATERRCLREAFPLHEFGPWVDTLKLVRIAYPGMGNHSLEEAIKSLELTSRAAAICPGREPHDALYDAVCCAVLLEHLLSLAGWERLPLDVLVHPRAARRRVS